MKRPGAIDLEPYEIGIDTALQPSQGQTRNSSCNNDTIYRNPGYQILQPTDETASDVLDFSALEQEVNAVELVSADTNWRITLWGSLALMATIDMIKGVEDATKEPTPARIAAVTGAAAACSVTGWLTKRAFRADRALRFFLS